MQTARRIAGLSALVLLLLASGCSYAAWADGTSLVQRHVTVTIEPMPDAPTRIASENGSIAVARSDDDRIVVNAIIHARSDARARATAITVVLDDDGRLVITPQWPDGGRMPNEGCSLNVTAPALGPLTITSTNGAISVQGLSGALAASTSNGAIRVNNFDGEIVARTSNGGVTVINATAGIDLLTSNGPVRVTMSPHAQGPAHITTSNGPIDLTVGPAFSGSLRATTSNASVNISTPHATGVTTTHSGTQAAFGNGHAQSVLRTRNGRITVRSD